MEWSGSLPQRERIVAGALVVALHVALGIALLSVNDGRMAALVERSLDVITLTRPPPPPEPKPRSQRPAQRRAGEAAPPNLKQDPTPVVAPVPIVPPIAPPPPVVTAPVAGVGAAPEAGAAAVVGPGTGAGGVGDGRGAGGSGDGDGAGDDEGYVPPRQTRGRLRNSDYPATVGAAGVSGRVSVRYLVEVTGQVTECDVTRSSGNAELDATTCKLIRERFKFRPSRDGRGNPVASYVVENHSWEVEG